MNEEISETQKQIQTLIELRRRIRVESTGKAIGTIFGEPAACALTSIIDHLRALEADRNAWRDITKTPIVAETPVWVVGPTGDINERTMLSAYHAYKGSDGKFAADSAVFRDATAADEYANRLRMTAQLEKITTQYSNPQLKKLKTLLENYGIEQLAEVLSQARLMCGADSPAGYTED